MPTLGSRRVGPRTGPACSLLAEDKSCVAGKWASYGMVTLMNLETPAGRKHKTCNGECSQTQNLKAGSSESSLAPPCDDCSFWWCSKVLLCFVMIL